MEQHLDDIALIITGCIAPVKDQKFLVLKDENERLKQYVDSILYYIEQSPFKKIVFCDNSAFTYTQVHELVDRAEKKGKTFEWLSFQGDREKVKTIGKGYGEEEIIRYALSHSIVVKNVKSIAKVTGRLKIDNISKILAKVKLGKNYFNRDIYFGHGIDTRFYICDKKFYCEHLMERYTQMDEQIGKEKALEEVFYSTLKKQKKHRTLPAYPAFKGISGGNGRDYSKISKGVISVYSFMCRIRIFNWSYGIVLGFKKCWLILTGKC